MHSLFVSDSKDAEAALSNKLFIHSWDYGLRWITCPNSKLLNSILFLLFFHFIYYSSAELCITGLWCYFACLFLSYKVFSDYWTSLTWQLELRLGIGGTSYEDFIRNLHLPMQLRYVYWNLNFIFELCKVVYRVIFTSQEKMDKIWWQKK